jgi:hypothetical protein
MKGGKVVGLITLYSDGLVEFSGSKNQRVEIEDIGTSRPNVVMNGVVHFPFPPKN